MIERHANIFDIQRNSYVDGPGIRTTIFFKGCNLHCWWCHNPEGQSFQKQILFYPNKCIGCGRCAQLTVENTDFVCYQKAKEICGKDYSVSEVLKVVTKDQIFYEMSGGGVTFSGGECMLQVDFLQDILKQCKESGIHTAVDTAGNVPWEAFEKVLPDTDLMLYDIKLMDSHAHKQYTGAGNELILENLSNLLRKGCILWVRIPIIPTVNDTKEEMGKIKAFFETNGYPKKIELLPYHGMGEHKYGAIGKECPVFSVPTQEKIKQLTDILYA